MASGVRGGEVVRPGYRQRPGITLLTTIETIGVGPTMWMYAGFNVLAFFFVLRLFPELAGRSLEDIETSLREGTFHPGGVPAKSKD